LFYAIGPATGVLAVSLAFSVCAQDGIVLAADSQATALSSGLPMRSHAKKVHQLTSHMAYASVGTEGLQQRIARALGSQAHLLTPRRERHELEEILYKTINPVQQKERAGWTQVKGTCEPAWGAIFCGWAMDGAWILEFDPSGETQFHNHFAAAGCASALAHVGAIGAEHLHMPERPMFAAQVLAYRVIETACRASAARIGPPIQMAVVHEQGVQMLGAIELDHVESAVRSHEAAERLFFDNICKRERERERQLDLLSGDRSPTAAAG
jgi:hypothetical protein